MNNVCFVRLVLAWIPIECNQPQGMDEEQYDRCLYMQEIVCELYPEKIAASFVEIDWYHMIRKKVHIHTD